MNNFEPYITVVVTARNDNHGGNMLRRMQAFLNAWFGQAARYDLPSEVIVVEWNPPADRPKLIDCLELPNDTGPCELRFVDVSGEVHRRFPNPEAIPLHQMAAKNAGIRRARGKFVLATNLDIVFSAELMRFLAERRLEPRTLYRMDRHDVASDIPVQGTLDELLAFCHQNMRRVFTAEGGFEFASDGMRSLENQDIVAPSEGIRFGSGWYPVERYDSEPFRWMREEAEVLLDRPRSAEPRLWMDVDAGPSAKGGVLSVEVVDAGGAVLAAATVRGRSKLLLQIPDRISSGLLRLRLQGDWAPVASDARFLSLRVFGLWWDVSQWRRALAVPEGANRARQTGIRVRSLGPRRIELALLPGEGASLDNLEVSLSDRAGNELFRVASGRLPPTDGDEYLLALDVGVAFHGLHGSEELVAGERPEQACFLDVAGTRPPTDWASTNQRISPFADHMRDPAYLHTNGCGDFTLLSRQEWWSLRGYAEFPIWPMHIDSLFCYAAHHAGIREVVLREPMRTFHIEHLSGAGWTPEGEQERVSRIESKGVSVIQNRDLMNWINQMRRFNAPAIFTLSNWGLADVDLPETTLGPGHLKRTALRPIRG
jgi:hypothetical protein